MKLKFTFLFLSFFSFCTAVMAQTEGDYRSNVATSGLWETAASWQRFTAGSWVVAGTPPSSTDGVVTIQAGDSIELTQARMIDQVRIDFGGSLAIFTLPAPTPNTIFTLNDAAEAGDITVNGRLTLSRGASLTGTGTILVNAGGEFIHRRLGVLDVLTTVDPSARMYFDEAPTLRSTITNNGTLTLLETGPINFEDATIVNNGLFNFMSTGNLFVNNAASTTNNLIQNSATGIIRKDISSGYVDIEVPINNAGTIQGVGQFIIRNIPINTGVVAPGNPIGSLLINDEVLEAGSNTVALRIESSNSPGNGHDQLNVTGTTSLAQVTLSVTENPAAPLGLYTIMTKIGGGLFTSNFAAVNIPPNYSLIYSPGSTTVQVQKNYSVLPLTWGNFTAVAKKNTVSLNWSTLQENNTALFVIEHSTNGRDFTTVTTLNAAGNSSTVSKYSATHSAPTLNGTNYYRVKQVDIDGRSSYSKTIPVQFKNTQVVLVQALPNPVISELQLSVQGKNVDVIITNTSGATVRNLRLAEGQHPVNFTELPAGIYHLSIYQDKKYVETQRIVKQ